jgi:hypothetical protein
MIPLCGCLLSVDVEGGITISGTAMDHNDDERGHRQVVRRSFPNVAIVVWPEKY